MQTVKKGKKRVFVDKSSLSTTKIKKLWIKNCTFAQIVLKNRKNT